MAQNYELHALAEALADRILTLLSSRIDRPQRLIKAKELMDRGCFSKTHLNRLLRDGKIPRPKLCSPAGRAWLESEIDDYFANLEPDDWDQYLARQERKATAGIEGMAKKKLQLGRAGNE